MNRKKKTATKAAKKRVKKPATNTPNRKTNKKASRVVARKRAAGRTEGEMPASVELGRSCYRGSTSVGHFETDGESITLTFEDREAAALLEKESLDKTSAIHAARTAFRIVGLGEPDVAENLNDALGLVDRASEEEKSEMMDFVKDSIDKAFERFDYRGD